MTELVAGSIAVCVSTCVYLCWDTYRHIQRRRDADRRYVAALERLRRVESEREQIRGRR